jgi:hypothetical protein
MALPVALQQMLIDFFQMAEERVVLLFILLDEHQLQL